MLMLRMRMMTRMRFDGRKRSEVVVKFGFSSFLFFELSVFR